MSSAVPTGGHADRPGPAHATAGATAPRVAHGPHHHHGTTDPARRALLGRRARLLALLSVVYNAVEAVVALLAGAAAGSVALVAFGLDSLVEVSSGVIVLWQFRHRMPEERERRAQRLMAAAFAALAVYVTVESVRTLVVPGADPEPSTVGIVVAAVSLALMPFLSRAQRRTGRELGSRSVQGDGLQTLLCTYLSGALLVGLVLNAALGWSWADPVVGLVVAFVAAREARELWRGEECGCTA